MVIFQATSKRVLLSELHLVETLADLSLASSLEALREYASLTVRSRSLLAQLEATHREKVQYF